MKKYLLILLLLSLIIFLLVPSSGSFISAPKPNGLILKTSSVSRIAHNKLSDFAVYFFNNTDDTLIIYAVPGLWLTHNDTAYMNGLYHVVYRKNGEVVLDSSRFWIFDFPAFDFCEDENSNKVVENKAESTIYPETPVMDEDPPILNWDDDLHNSSYSQMCYAKEHFAKNRKLILPHGYLTFEDMFKYSAEHMEKGEYTVVFYYYISDYMKKVIREDIYDKNKKVPMGLYKAKKKIIVE